MIMEWDYISRIDNIENFFSIDSVPLTYLIITIVNFYYLLLYQQLLLFILYTVDPDFTYLFNNFRDIQFVIYTGALALFLTFII